MSETLEELGTSHPSDDSSGIPNLDLLLGGGIPRGSLVMVVGPPGSGKTTLATQVAFGAAAAGRPVLILTALSEPTSKLVAHLRSFAFFDETLIGGPVRILSLEQFLPTGLATTGEELLGLTREMRVGLVVLDGFSGMRGADPQPQAARQFLYHVGSTLSLRGTTTIITTEADPRDPALFPEATTADIIVGLHSGLAGMRHQRGIEILKLRGRSELSGLHGLRVGQVGMTVYPRLESRVAMVGPAPVSLKASKEMREVPVPFGIPGLDRLLGGGLTLATTTLAAGVLGTGKTLLGLQFTLAGLRAGESAVFLGFRETVEQLVFKADLLGGKEDLRKALWSTGALTFLHWPPVELNVDIVADYLLAALTRTGARRLVIDSIAELERALRTTSGADRVDEYLAALVVTLRDRGVTTLAIKETGRTMAEDAGESTDPIAMVADNVLVLRRRDDGDQFRRTLTVLKMRFAANSAVLHDFVITPPHGIQVRPPFPEVQGDAPPDSTPSPVGEEQNAARSEEDGA